MECTICLQNTACTKRFFKCNHTFHIECIQQWLNIHKTCPNCRSSESSKSLKSAHFDSLFYSMNPKKLNDSEKTNLMHVIKQCINHDIYMCHSGIPPFGSLIFCNHCKNYETTSRMES